MCENANLRKRAINGKNANIVFESSPIMIFHWKQCVAKGVTKVKNHDSLPKFKNYCTSAQN